MRRLAPLWLLLACAGPRAGRHPATAPAPAARPRDDALRSELLMRAVAEQSTRYMLLRKLQDSPTSDSLPVYFKLVVAIDTANTTRLRRIVAEHGWPGRSLVGADGVDATLLLVQHADRDRAFQEHALSLLERARATGDADGRHVALLTDCLAVARGAPQLYGTQVDLVGERIVLKPIADSAGVDARRARVGLPPLAEQARSFARLSEHIALRRYNPPWQADVHRRAAAGGRFTGCVGFPAYDLPRGA